MGGGDAKLARRLVRDARTASLSTLALRPAGHPFGTLVALASDDRGRPLLLLSSLAEHAKNLDASPWASILVADHAAADPLECPRVTLVGTCRKVPDSEVGEARETFLAKHPSASTYVDFRDFAFYRLEPGEIRLVVGFGKMGWVDSHAYAEG